MKKQPHSFCFMLLTRPDKAQKLYRVIVASPDTDVFAFLVHHFSCMGLCEIVFKTGKKRTHADLTRLIPIHKVVCLLSEA